MESRNYLCRHKFQLYETTYGDSGYFLMLIVTGIDYYLKMVSGNVRPFSDDLALSKQFSD